MFPLRGLSILWLCPLEAAISPFHRQEVGNPVLLGRADGATSALPTQQPRVLADATMKLQALSSSAASQHAFARFQGTGGSLAGQNICMQCLVWAVRVSRIHMHVLLA